ncbi:hypothetical protein MP638_006291 [Amoeboaphelidium occidentale]|nr:hypothetical protein MP638_006291 [Amoeboaphelidium occidentale]
MGYIRKLTETKSECRVFNLSKFMDNQNLLQTYLQDMVNSNRRSSGPSVPLNMLEALESYPSIPLSVETLDFRTLQECYDQQSQLVELAVLMAGRIRLQPNTDENAPDNDLRAWRRLYNQVMNDRSSNITFTRDGNENYELALSMANSRASLDEINSMIKNVLENAKEGDIIDICGYRGTGYYYVLENNPSQGIFRAVKTKGQYGCHLPAAAWPLIEEHGVNYFKSADVWACYIPSGKLVEVKDARAIHVSESDDQYIVSWLVTSNRLSINGSEYEAELWKMC